MEPSAPGAPRLSRHRTGSDGGAPALRSRRGNTGSGSGFGEVRALEQQGQYDQAVARGRELLKQFPHAAEIRQRLAKDLARNGKCEEAASLYAAAPASGQAASHRETMIGSCYFYKSDFPAALTHLKRAAQAAPNDKPGALLLA